MADAAAPAAADDGAKRRTFRRFSYRGVDLEQLLELKTEEMVQLFGARQRRRYVFFLETSRAGDAIFCPAGRAEGKKVSQGEAPRRSIERCCPLLPPPSIVVDLPFARASGSSSSSLLATRCVRVSSSFLS